MFRRRLFESPFWTTRNPFEELLRMKSEMEKLSSEFFGSKAYVGGAGVFPLINLTEDKDSFKLQAELPGVQTEELEISVTGKNLSITGERKIAPEAKDAKYHRREREAGKFNRMVTLPNEVSSDKVQASLTNGILTIVLPKSEAAKPRVIAVK